MLSKCPSVTEEFIQTNSELTTKYVPIENDPTIPYGEKRKYMEQWWALSEESLR